MHCSLLAVCSASLPQPPTGLARLTPVPLSHTITLFPLLSVILADPQLSVYGGKWPCALSMRSTPVRLHPLLDCLNMDMCFEL